MKYDFKGGKDGATIKRLLKVLGLEKCKELVTFMLFESKDEFLFSGGGYTITVLSACSNKLVQEMAMRDSPISKMSPAARATYLAGQEVINERERQRQKDR